MFAQHTVLFVKVLDDVLLLLVQEAGEGNKQEPKRIKCQTHGAIIALESTLKDARD